MGILKGKLINAREQLRYWPRTMRLVWNAAPGWTVVWATLLLAQGALPPVLIKILKLLVDRLVGAAGAGGRWEQIRPVIGLVLLAGGLMLLSEILQSLGDWVRTAQAELVQDHIRQLIHLQSFSVDLAFYESSEFHDQLDRARTEAANRPLALLENCGSLLQNGLTFIAMAVVLSPYSWWLPLVMLLSTAPSIVVVLRFDRRYHRWW